MSFERRHISLGSWIKRRWKCHSTLKVKEEESVFKDGFLVGHQSTNWMVLFVLMVATAAFTSLADVEDGSKALLVISATESRSW
ncbi:hypothetical protein VNO77_39428 [Canavalia gladiata]|uniref:Uncharacterized protein n=1 Tax=Canavalia gladiata TaxID=3824 RepID=A0AAN9KAF9_CANGL